MPKRIAISDSPEPARTSLRHNSREDDVLKMADRGSWGGGAFDGSAVIGKTDPNSQLSRRSEDLMIWERLVDLLSGRGSRAPLQGAPSVEINSEAGRIPTVRFDQSRVTDVVRADLKRNVYALTAIPKDLRGKVYEIALQSILKGRDLHLLASGFLALGIEGITRADAALISRNLHNRASAIINREHQLSIGITKARWQFSGASCLSDPRSASPEELARDAAHQTANGEAYDVRDGMLLNGRRTWPGYEDGCKCISRPIIPALEGD